MIKKILLNLDALTVDSFETGAAAWPTGTVHAASGATTPESPCVPATSVLVCGTWRTCPLRQTEYNSCVVDCECTNRQGLCPILG